jgi:hypothetical protein
MDQMRHTEAGPGAGDTKATETLSPAVDDRMHLGAGPLGRRGIALPAALGALLLAGTVALGAFGVVPTGQRDSAPADEPAKAVVDPTEKPEATPKAKPDATSAPAKEVAPAEPTKKPEATPKAKPDATSKPKPKPTAKPEPKATAKPAPAVGKLALEAARKAEGVKLHWGAFKGDGFDYYKVVRSTNSTVAWPLGAGDVLVAAIGDRGETWAFDAHPKADTYWYRVFAVRATDAGYRVLARSNVVKVVVPKPAPKPTPEPKILAFEANVTPDGVALAWEACGADGFRYHKVVRSATNPKPTWPLNDGSELIAVIENPGTTSFLDTAVEPGQTWHYRVLSIGYLGDGTKVVLGITPVLTVTVE